MNAVEIEQAVSILAEAPFDAVEFPFAFLEAFGNKATTIKILKSGKSNNTDVPGAILQRNNIHIKVCKEGEVPATLKQLRESPATARQKAKYILATDGITLESERLTDGETLACEFDRFPDRFTFFLPLAGISTVRQIDESAFDIRATSRLNRLYVELLKTNPDWDSDARRQELNHFFARLIFCFFAEDTKIFHTRTLFTATVEQMSDRDSSNTHWVIAEIFRAMQVKSTKADRDAARLPNWANTFPYVNGGLFSGSLAVPKLSRIARSYLLHVGNLDWTKINPDIFGSMIQAVADDEERGALGMHYTSVPNILKVLNPLFLDELREKLAEAGDNSRKLLNLRNRMARIRVFDPACGSGNFLVIAYKQMREIEVEINKRRGEADRRSEIPLTNFRGIEIRHFSCEIARLALIIAEYQCDVLYRGEKLALAEFLPLEADNWITCGNALRLDWTGICPPTGESVKHRSDDLFSKPIEQAEVGFENEGGETYICGNPPYYGSRRQQEEQKDDLKQLASRFVRKWKSLDYVAGWIFKAASYLSFQRCRFAFVSTSSVAEGLQVSLIWPHTLGADRKIFFAHRPFKWSNLAASNAGVTVVIVGVTSVYDQVQYSIYDNDSVRVVNQINPYLVPADTIYIEPRSDSICSLPRMVMGSMPRDGGNLILEQSDADRLVHAVPATRKWLRRYVGTDELLKGIVRYCLWITDCDANEATVYPEISSRLKSVKEMRLASPLESTREFADRPHRFVYLAGESHAQTVAVGGVSSENRKYLPVDLLASSSTVSNLAFAMYDAPAWTVAIVSSTLHLVWVAAICGRLETRYRYSSTLGWNTFPVPALTEQNRMDLTRCAEEILLAREVHFPATIADLYAPETMPDNLRKAHERNDEVLERIYIGRRFKNDTERLAKLFEMYNQMTSKHPSPVGANKPTSVKRKGAEA